MTARSRNPRPSGRGGSQLIFTQDHPGLANPRRTWRLLTTAREAYRDEAARRVCHAATRLAEESS